MTRPADGERRAARGLTAQYRVAAQLIYDAMCRGNVEWIRVADPEAGRVDDIQIASPGFLDAYQIKWSVYEERISFNDLVSSQGSGPEAVPCPVQQLADGWRRLTALHPGRAARVHFLTRSSASSADRIEGSDIVGPRHLQAFMADAYPQRRNWISESCRAAIPGWLPAIDRLRAASGFPEKADFAAFSANLFLDLAYRLETAQDADIRTARRLKDIEQLAGLLQRLVTATVTVVELDKARLLAELGWGDRFEFRFRHELPADALAYRPVESTVDALLGCLAAHRSGYMGLVGAPGSGKSTVLTHTLRYRPGFRTVRYYAYIRDDRALGNRGEALSFLHDVCLALKGHGFPKLPPGRALAPASLEELTATLEACIADLHEEWRLTGIVTLIMIDGLDHVTRELHPGDSFLRHLPMPESLPEGIVFVLGTQFVGLEGLPPRVKAQLSDPARLITMEPLARSAVREIATARLASLSLGEDGLETIFLRSGGHPLALAYLLNRLAQAATLDEATALLKGTRQYGGDIATVYAIHWEDLGTDPEVRDMLGLAARFRDDIPLAGLRLLCTPVALSRLARGSVPLLSARGRTLVLLPRQFPPIRPAQDGGRRVGRIGSQGGRVLPRAARRGCGARTGRLGVRLGADLSTRAGRGRTRHT